MGVLVVVVVVVVGEAGKGGLGGGEGGAGGWGGRFWERKRGRGRVEGVGSGRGGVGGGRGGQQQVLGRKSGKVCKVCLQTAEFAPSSVNAASCRLGVLWRAFFGGLKGGKKGGFIQHAARSADTPNFGIFLSLTS